MTKSEKEKQRIAKMVQSWKEEGRAFTRIENDDADFFKKAKVDSEKVWSTSQTGLDIIYYDSKRFDYINNKYIKKEKMSKRSKSDIDLIYKSVPTEYKMIPKATGKKSIMYLNNGGTCLGPVESLPDDVWKDRLASAKAKYKKD